MMKKTVYYISFLFFLFSCSQVSFIDIGRKSPSKMERVESSGIIAESFILSKTILLKWGSHHLAKEYIVYRDDKYDGSFSEKIYQGTDLFTKDIPPVMDKIYYYKMSIKYDAWESEKSNYTSGVASEYTKDVTEANIDEKGNVKIYQLETDELVTGMIYYFRDGKSIFSDEDYYSVSVSPYKNIQGTIQLLDNLVKEDISVDVDNRYSLSISNGIKINLYNDTSVTKDITFRIVRSNLSNKSGRYTIVLSKEGDEMAVNSPTVDPITNTNIVTVKWLSHNMAEKYILYRYDSSGENAIGTKIYEGVDFEYTDTGIPSTNKIYYYRLSIVFNNSSNISKPSECTGGLKLSIADDNYGENHRISSGTSTTATQYYFTDGINTFSDTDSYCISVSPFKNVRAILSLDENLISGDLNISVDGKYSKSISNGSLVNLYNDTSSTKDIFFVISRGNLNNRVGNYTIKLSSENDEIVVTAPTVEAISSTNAVKVKWNKHNLADKYILYRYDSSGENAIGTKIYEGVDFEYTDTGIPSTNKIYYYRLSIVFNNSSNISKPSECTGGLKLSIADDNYGENHRISSGTSTTATQYYFTDGVNTFSDTDSYCVSISPFKNVKGTIKLLDSFVSSDLSIDVDSRYKSDISNGTIFYLYNDTSVVKDIFFSVAKNKMNNKVGRYTITLENESEITVTKPQVSSYKTENSVSINMVNNSLAEQYILYRYDTIGGIRTEIYRGLSLSYIDNPPLLDKIYYYTTAIKYYSYQSKESPYSTGVKGIVTEDAEEENDTVLNATLLVSDKKYSIYYCSDTSGNKYEDSDWHYLTLSANEMQLLTINLATSSLKNNLYFQQEGDAPKIIDNTTKSFRLYNNSGSISNVKFRLYTDRNISGYYSIKTETKKSLILEKPVVSSYSVVNGIVVSWASLEIAEKYYLYRSLSETGTFVKIGEFTGLTYTDNTAGANKIYYYRVSSLFGINETEKSPCGFGVTGSIAKDSYESNDNESVATQIGNDILNSNIYCFNDNNNLINDVDNYYIDVPAKSTSIIKINNLSNILDNELSFTKKGESSVLVKENNDYIFINTETVGKRYYFKVSVADTTNFNKIGSYSIQLIPATNENIRAPEYITAKIENNTIVLNWYSVLEAESYILYRKSGSGNFVKIADNIVTNSFTDITFLLENNISYKVQSYSKGYYSEMSVESNNVIVFSTSLVIDNNSLKASLFEYSNKIVLNWDRLENDSSSSISYKIYRYLSKTDTIPVLFTTSNNYYEDSSANVNTPYFYRVACIKDGKEYSKSDFSFGAYSSNVDYYEPNDNLLSVVNLTTGTVFSDSQKPVIYSVLDGLGNVISDEDWYLYNGLPLTFFLNIELNTSSNFSNGDLKVVFYYNGQYTTPQSVLKGQSNSYSFSSFGGVTGNVSVFFKIYVDSSAISKTKNYIETYKVSLSNSF